MRNNLIKGTVANYYSLKGELVRVLVSNCEMGGGQAGTELDSGVLRPTPTPRVVGAPPLCEVWPLVECPK